MTSKFYWMWNHWAWSQCGIIVLHDRGTKTRVEKIGKQQGEKCIELLFMTFLHMKMFCEISQIFLKNRDLMKVPKCYICYVEFLLLCV